MEDRSVESILAETDRIRSRYPAIPHLKFVELANSYSGLEISEKKSVKDPVRYNGKDYLCTGAVSIGCGHKFTNGCYMLTAYEIIPISWYRGDRSKLVNYDTVESQMGYKNMIVFYKGAQYVLTKEFRFTYKLQESQGNLFS